MGMSASLPVLVAYPRLVAVSSSKVPVLRVRLPTARMDCWGGRPRNGVGDRLRGSAVEIRDSGAGNETGRLLVGAAGVAVGRRRF